MGAGNLFCMEPPVGARSQFEGNIVVLQIVFAHIDVVAVAAHIVHDAGSLGSWLFALLETFLKIARVFHFLSDA